MNTPFAIRIAADADAAAIARMANALARNSGHEGTAMDAGRVRTHLLAARDGIGVFVADRGGTAVGYALHLPAYETAFGERGRYLSDLYVDTGHRRAGIGRALIRAVARKAAAEGGTFLWWVADGADPAATRLYAKLADVTEDMRANAATGDAFRRLIAENA